MELLSWGGRENFLIVMLLSLKSFYKSNLLFFRLPVLVIVEGEVGPPRRFYLLIYIDHVNGVVIFIKIYQRVP